MKALGALTRLLAPFLPAWPAPHAATGDVARLGDLLDTSPTLLLAFRTGLPRGYHYYPLQVYKRNGAPRAIYAPSPPLKALQRALLRGYLNDLEAHPAALGFRQGHSIADHARAHQGQALVLAADLEDFFDNTPAPRVRECFATQGWDEPAADILTRLCTFRGALPQGAPTSPALSNLVNVGLDEALAALAGRTGGRYTRYGDDLAFSWPDETLAPEVERALHTIVLAHGYRLNAEKWQLYRPLHGKEPRLTGIVLGRDGELQPLPDVLAAVQDLEKVVQSPHPDPIQVARLHGYRGFINMLSPQKRKQPKRRARSRYRPRQ